MANKIVRKLKALIKKLLGKKQDESSSQLIGNETVKIKISSFGNPNVSKAAEDPNVQIRSLKISKDGLRYKWAKGGCESFGAADKNDYSHALAVLGYGDGLFFRCAKLDWISTSRTTRDFHNLYEGYNGFSAEEFFAAPKRCFFICSVDGKKRTNIIVD